MKPLKKLKNHFRVFEKVLSGSPQQSAAFLRKYKNGKLLYVPDAHYCYYLEDEVDEKYYIKSEKAYKLTLDLRERGILEGKEKAVYYRDKVTTAMASLRTPVDKLEMIVDKDIWPMPTYAELIFEV